MNNIKVLDCTLRDGGYVNQWQFGENNIKRIVSNLIDANIDIIECGFLTEKGRQNNHSSLFDSIQQVKEVLPTSRKESMTVCMINYGDFNVENLPQFDGSSIDGIRLAFHKKDVKESLKISEIILKKGYKLFLQPMVSVSYSDEDFLDLIEKANQIKPYAFYIVDSFGVMKRNDLMRFFYLTDHNLSEDIFVGYHSHNNIQLAYSNAQSLVDQKTKRDLIIDSSVFGMGRGAGNLNTELFIEYLNELNNSKYKVKPLLRIIDQVLNPIYVSNFWGYSLAHYVSAMNNCHPNYASYLDDKNTLTVEHINELLSALDDSKRNVFDKEYIEKLYVKYQDRAIVDDKSRKKLKDTIKQKTVLLIAPGSSIIDEKERVNNEISSKNCVSISVNFNPDKFDCDYVFVSNIRRYGELKNINNSKIIKTSNIKNGSSEGFVVNYSGLLNDIESVEDNAGLMLIQLLVDIGVKKIKLAGLDGYSHDINDNFAEKDLAFMKSASVMDAMNSGITEMLNRFAEIIDVEFLTTPKYVRLGTDK